MLESLYTLLDAVLGIGRDEFIILALRAKIGAYLCR